MRLVLVLAVVAACADPAPDFDIVVGATTTGEPADAFGFAEIGVLTATSQVFTIVNRGDAAGTFREATLASGSPFTHAATAASAIPA